MQEDSQDFELLEESSIWAIKKACDMGHEARMMHHVARGPNQTPHAITEETYTHSGGENSSDTVSARVQAVLSACNAENIPYSVRGILLGGDGEVSVTLNYPHGTDVCARVNLEMNAEDFLSSLYGYIVVFPYSSSPSEERR